MFYGGTTGNFYDTNFAHPLGHAVAAVSSSNGEFIMDRQPLNVMSSRCVCVIVFNITYNNIYNLQCTQYNGRYNARFRFINALSYRIWFAYIQRTPTGNHN